MRLFTFSNPVSLLCLATGVSCWVSGCHAGETETVAADDSSISVEDVGDKIIQIRSTYYGNTATSEQKTERKNICLEVDRVARQSEVRKVLLDDSDASLHGTLELKSAVTTGTCDSRKKNQWFRLKKTNAGAYRVLPFLNEKTCLNVQNWICRNGLVSCGGEASFLNCIGEEEPPLKQTFRFEPHKGDYLIVGESAEKLGWVFPQPQPEEKKSSLLLYVISDRDTSFPSETNPRTEVTFSFSNHYFFRNLKIRHDENAFSFDPIQTKSPPAWLEKKVQIVAISVIRGEETGRQACLTLGPLQKEKPDSEKSLYKVSYEPCNKTDANQWFVVTKHPNDYDYVISPHRDKQRCLDVASGSHNGASFYPCNQGRNQKFEIELDVDSTEDAAKNYTVIGYSLGPLGGVEKRVSLSDIDSGLESAYFSSAEKSDRDFPPGDFRFLAVE